MSFFQTLSPTILKESKSTALQIEKLKEILPKASAPVQEVIAQDISLLEMGLYGENKILFELTNSHIPMFILHDVFLEKDGLTAQIDFMVICQKCVYVIECKNLFGNIEINNKGDFIRTVQLGKAYRKEGIYSPITQNQRHMDLMREFTVSDNPWKNIVNNFFGDAFGAMYIPIVVLANDKTVVNDRYARKEIKSKVIRADQLNAFINDSEYNSKVTRSSITEMKVLAEWWIANSTDNQTDYIEKYRKLEREYRAGVKAAKVETVPICPKCGIQMVKRTVKTGERKGRQIWGCPNYPKCREIINID